MNNARKDANPGMITTGWVAAFLSVTLRFFLCVALRFQFFYRKEALSFTLSTQRESEMQGYKRSFNFLISYFLPACRQAGFLFLIRHGGQVHHPPLSNLSLPVVPAAPPPEGMNRLLFVNLAANLQTNNPICSSQAMDHGLSTVDHRPSTIPPV